MSLTKKLVRRILPPPVNVRHAEYSLLFSADDEPVRPSERLINLSLEAVRLANQVNFDGLAKRVKNDPYLNVWPGEHYKLLAGLLQAIRPKRVVEIGTSTGLSALAMKQFLPVGGELFTFDILPWKTFPGGSFLKDEDFKDGTLIQYTDDLSAPEGFRKHAEMLKDADLIFVDAAKDGSQEQRFIDNFKSISFTKAPVVVFDDIRLWNMLKIWRQLDKPKLDITSFGHWSGTGLVDWV